MMVEVPSALFNLKGYATLGVAGISIGSKDLTQLLLGADRDLDRLGDIRRASPSGHGVSAPADPAGASGRTADIDLRPGAVGPS
jgi:phosphoenolpyruvate synthase/pyruvate phosphate dikinase